MEKKGKRAKSASRERESLAGGISRLGSSYIGALDERFRQRNQKAENISLRHLIGTKICWQTGSPLRSAIDAYAGNRAIAETGLGLAKVKRTE